MAAKSSSSLGADSLLEAAERRQEEKKEAEEQRMQERVTQRQKHLAKLKANKEKTKRGAR